MIWHGVLVFLISHDFCVNLYSLTGILEIFLALLLDLWDGVIGGAEPGLGLPLLVHHKLGEVPLDGVHQEASLLGLKYDGIL